MKYTSAPLDYSQMYRLRDPLNSRYIRLGTADDGLLTHEETYGLAHGRLRPDTPVRLMAARGFQLADFLWSGYTEIACVAERIVHLLDLSHVSGWSTYSVELLDRKGQAIPGYSGFAVTGAECERDRSRSYIVSKPPPTPTGEEYEVYRGLYFDESQWDCSDMFWIRHRGIVVTERTYQVLKLANITNVEFTALKDVEIRVSLDKYEQ